MIQKVLLAFKLSACAYLCFSTIARPLMTFSLSCLTFCLYLFIYFSDMATVYPCASSILNPGWTPLIKWNKFEWWRTVYMHICIHYLDILQIFFRPFLHSQEQTHKHSHYFCTVFFKPSRTCTREPFNLNEISTIFCPIENCL